MRPAGRFFWKTFCIDVLFLILLFATLVFAKQFVGSFFLDVESYQQQIQLLEPGLANQSTEALLALDPLVGDFYTQVLWTYVFMIFVVPIFLGLLFFISQSVNVGILQRTLSWRSVGRGALYGLFVLIIFYILAYLLHFATADPSILLILSLLLLTLLAYVWYTLVIVSGSHSWRKATIAYKKFVQLFPVFFLFAIGGILVDGIVIILGVRYVTASLYGTWLGMGIAGLLLLVLLQYARYLYLQRVTKFH